MDFLPKEIKQPVIISGGCGSSKHFIDGLKKEKISAVATANLLNFIGNSLKNSRENLIKNNYNFPKWDEKKMIKLDNILKIGNNIR